MADVVRNYIIRYKAEDKASAPIAGLTKGLTAGSTAADSMRGKVASLNPAVVDLAQNAHDASISIRELNGLMAATGKGFKERADTISQSLGRIDFNAGTTNASLGKVASTMTGIGSQATGIGTAQAAVQKLQRSAYGAWKNAEQVDAALGKIGARAPELEAAALSTGNMGIGLKTTSAEGKSAAGSIGGLTVAMMALRAGEQVIDAIADGTRRAREDTEGWAAEALQLRDNLRELANLKGKPGADDSVVADQLRLRAETGMNGAEARKFQEQFLGSLPLAKDKGGITDKVGQDLAGQVGRIATRTGLDGQTAGDLAGSLGMFGQVPDAEVGAGRVQQVVDLLNDGRGNLSPLAKELMKDAASTVGDGKMFPTLQSRAAAISTSTAMGAIGRSSTRVNQAIAGLSGFDKDQGDQLRLHGITDTDDFETRIRKIKPLVDEAKRQGKDPLGYLGDMGFKNQVEQKAIVGFVENYDSLRRKNDSVRETDPTDPNRVARVAGQRSKRLNDDFYATDKAARNRVADAKLDESEYNRGRKQENLLIERKEAEARLRQAGQIDTPGSNLQDTLLGGFGLSEKLGGPSGRQLRIDSEVKRQAIEHREGELGRPLNDEERRDFSERPAEFAANYMAASRERKRAATVPAPKMAGMPGVGPQAAGQVAGGAGVDPIGGQLAPGQGRPMDPALGMLGQGAAGQPFAFGPAPMAQGASDKSDQIIKLLSTIAGNTVNRVALPGQSYVQAERR